MQHAPLDFVPRMLLRVATSINDDELLPLRVPVLTISFLHRLEKQCNHSTKPLARFLALIPGSRLTDEVIRLVLPEAFEKLRAEIKSLQHAKEEAVANQDWQRAVAVRDRADSLKDRLRQMSEGAVIDVEPDHILQAISNLGFDQAITVDG